MLTTRSSDPGGGGEEIDGSALTKKVLYVVDVRGFNFGISYSVTLCFM